MAKSNSAVNIVIRAKDLARGTPTKVTTCIRTVGKASKQVISLAGKGSGNSEYPIVIPAFEAVAKSLS